LGYGLDWIGIPVHNRAIEMFRAAVAVLASMDCLAILVPSFN